MKIAIDAMGGDNAPKEIVLGTLAIAQEMPNIIFQLYGDEKQIRYYMQADMPKNIEIVHTEEKITGDDEPVKAIRRKKKASMVMAATAVKDGTADALFSAGNTGALVAAGLLIIGRIPGVDRPALMATIPAILKGSHPINMLDMGANSDAKPKNVYQHAVLANYYAKYIRRIERPTVGLINNGAETNKGNKLAQESYDLLAKDSNLNFIGNVESRYIFDNKADVLVADGYTGNAILKTIEGTAKTLVRLLKDTIKDGGVSSKVGALFLKNALTDLSQTLDYGALGGAILIGVKAPVFKTHGASESDAVYNTLKQTVEMTEAGVIDKMASSFKTNK